MSAEQACQGLTLAHHSQGETVCLSTNRDSQAGCRRAPASQTGRQSDSCRIDKAERRGGGGGGTGEAGKGDICLGTA